MVRFASSLFALIIITLAAQPALARDRVQVQIDLDLVAELEAYRDAGVPLDPSIYARPQVHPTSQWLVDRFEPRAGGHSLRRASDGIKEWRDKIRANPHGINVPIYTMNRTTWERVFYAIKSKLDTSIYRRYRERDELFNGLHTIRSYSDLKRAGEAAEKRLGRLSRRDVDYLHAVKLRALETIKTTLKKKRVSFAGRWNTTWLGSGAEMVLRVSGRTVTGSYKHMGGTIKGTLADDGRTLNATWHHAKDKKSGKLRFTLSADGTSFRGRYGYKTNLGSNYWNGKRK